MRLITGPFLFLILGVVIIFGTIKKWKFLVDPPEELWMIYSYSFWKKWFGADSKFFITWNWCLGILCIVMSIIVIVNMK